MTMEDVENGDGQRGKQTEAGCRGRGGWRKGSGWRSLGVGESWCSEGGTINRWPGAWEREPGQLPSQGARGPRVSTLGLPEHHPHGAGGRGPERQEWVPTQSRGLQDQDCLTPFPASKIDPAPSEGSRESIQGAGGPWADPWDHPPPPVLGPHVPPRAPGKAGQGCEVGLGSGGRGVVEASPAGAGGWATGVGTQGPQG